jgi:hypothetical protein
MFEFLRKIFLAKPTETTPLYETDPADTPPPYEQTEHFLNGKDILHIIVSIREISVALVF